ncbi:MAG: SH3 domain-containing protein [Anaerolineae bacterium]|nr:SH3 domain-containing protein [Anaerolineae bacterium]
MRQSFITMLAVLVLVLTGCNLGAAPDETEEPLPDQTVASGAPTVTILSPEDGSESVIDEEILVSIQAQDSVGVTRAQLFANGQIVNTVSSEALEGDPNFEGVLRFTPRTTGDFTLRVLAFRGATSSAPAEIVVTVREDQSSIVVTTRPDNNAPQIPNDGVCRAYINTGLNFRSEPTTSRDNVIIVLSAGDLYPVVARLGDNSWWKLSVNGTFGWVAASFTTLYGNCSGVPVENVIINTPTTAPTATRTSTAIPTNTPLPTLTNTPRPTATPGLPDLIIPSVAWEGEEDEPIILPTGEEDVTVVFTVQISNLGRGPSSQFSVLMTVELNGSDEDPVEYDLGAVGSLNADQSIVLEQEVVFPEVGEYDIRVEVDPDDAVDEISEVNNRADLTVEVVAES